MGSIGDIDESLISKQPEKAMSLVLILPALEGEFRDLISHSAIMASEKLGYQNNDLDDDSLALGRKFGCPKCSQMFTRRHNLKSHLLIHSQVKPHICTLCLLSFRRSHDLKRHRKLHTGEKPFQCGNCGRYFARSDALVRHNNSQTGCDFRVNRDPRQGPSDTEDKTKKKAYESGQWREPQNSEIGGDMLENGSPINGVSLRNLLDILDGSIQQQILEPSSSKIDEVVVSKDLVNDLMRYIKRLETKLGEVESKVYSNTQSIDTIRDHLGARDGSKE